MGRRFYWGKKLVAVAIVSAVLVGGVVAFWQTGYVVEAALLDPHPGLVGWWRFDEGTGTIATDNSGNGNDGTIYGATYVDGTYGEALSFDGVDNYVHAQKSDDLSSLTDELSVAFWIFYVDGEAYGSYVNYQDFGGTGGWDIRTNWDDFRFRIYIGGWQELYVGAIPQNVWTHFVCIYDGEYMRVYMNGTLFGTPKSQTGTISYPADPVLWIGRNRRIADRYVEGVFDDVRIYGQALSASEVQEVFQKGPDFSSELLAEVPEGTTQLISTISWQGDGNINVTIQSPSTFYTEENVSAIYQKNTFSSSTGEMLNIKRLSVSVTALSSDENWNINLEYDKVEDYTITVEVQR